MTIEPTVTIPKNIYDRLMDESAKWYALEVYGVDSWEGYEEAMKIYHEGYTGPGEEDGPWAEGYEERSEPEEEAKGWR